MTMHADNLSSTAATRRRRLLALGWGMALGAVLGAPRAALAQRVALDMRPLRSAYVLGEPVAVQIKIDNHGAQPLVIDDHEAFRRNRIFFEINLDPQVLLAPLREGRILEELDLERDESFTGTIDLSAWYPLLREGRYYVNLVLLHNDLRYASERRMFDVVPGIELASVAAPLPGRPPSERGFKLVYWTRGEREIAFLRASDRPSGVVWTTLDLGPLVRVTQPRMKVNADGSLTVVHQATRDTMVTSVIRSDAKGPVLIEQKQAVDTTTTPLMKAMTDTAAAQRETRNKKRGK